MKKFVSLILVLLSIVSCMGVGFFGVAAESDIVIENGVLKKYSASDEFYVIPDEVTAIAENAFVGCDNLTEIYIGQNVVSIGSGAFLNCTNLKQICIAGTQGIAVNNPIAKPDAMILINNDNRAVRKSIATAKMYKWSTYTVFTVKNKKVLTYLYGAESFSVASECGKKIFAEVEPYYILFADYDMYYDVHNITPDEVKFNENVDPGFFFRLNMNFNNLSKLRDKSEIENGNDGPNSWIKRLINLFKH